MRCKPGVGRPYEMAMSWGKGGGGVEGEWGEGEAAVEEAVQTAMLIYSRFQSACLQRS